MDRLNYNPDNLDEYFSGNYVFLTLENPTDDTSLVVVYDRIYPDKSNPTLYPIEIDGLRTFIYCADINSWKVWGLGAAFPNNLIQSIGDAIESREG